MKSIYALSLLAGASSLVSAQSCQNIAGNYYCSAVDQIIYNNVGYSGSYQKVTNFDTSDCSCSQAPQSFSGSLSPLDEELSVHFRGPISLKQFAYYSVNSTPSKKAKRDEEPAGPVRHKHHVHKRHAGPVADPDVVYVTQPVYVTKVVYVDGSAEAVPAPAASAPADNSSSDDEDTSSQDNVQQTPTPQSSAASAPPAAAASSAASSPSPAASTPPSSSSPSSSPDSPASPSSASASPSPSSSSASLAPSPSSSSSPSPSPSSSPSAAPASGSDFSRSGYYSSDGTSNGLVFLNNMGGGSCSGVWDSCFGNSLSYASSDGTSCSSNPTVLSDTTVLSDNEFSIWTDSPCGANGGDCGYYRPGTTAYHGFGGDTKIFAFEFIMPHDTSSAGTGFNGDMPAIWLLNAQIPRTLQYGNSACSCWSTGCGELDLFEVLNSGNDYLTSHLHSDQGASKRSVMPGSFQRRDGGGGTSDYINRPTTSSMKAAVIFNNGAISITVLPDSTTFDNGLSNEQVQAWLSSSSSLGTANVNI